MGAPGARAKLDSRVSFIRGPSTGTGWTISLYPSSDVFGFLSYRDWIFLVIGELVGGRDLFRAVVGDVHSAGIVGRKDDGGAVWG